MIRLLADAISVRRRDTALFAPLSFAIDSGETLLVTGANGSGKTTLLRALAGFLPLSGGRLTVALDPPGEAPASLAGYCHYLGHGNAVKAALTPRETLDFDRDPAAPDGEGALATVGLARAADLPIAYLSAGQRRRLALARLIVAARPFWLLDEPSAALDAEGEAMLAALVGAQVARGGVVVAATHAPLSFAPTNTIRLSAA
jgi:heme exporter protein A